MSNLFSALKSRASAPLSSAFFAVVAAVASDSAGIRIVVL